MHLSSYMLLPQPLKRFFTYLKSQVVLCLTFIQEMRGLSYFSFVWLKNNLISLFQYQLHPSSRKALSLSKTPLKRVMDGSFHLMEIPNLRLSLLPCLSTHPLHRRWKTIFYHHFTPGEFFWQKVKKVFDSVQIFMDDNLIWIINKINSKFSCSFSVFKYANRCLITKVEKQLFLSNVIGKYTMRYICFTHFCIWNVILHSKERKIQK